MEELKPCPFCGEKVEFIDRNSGPGMRPSMCHMVITCCTCQYEVDFGQRSMHKMRQKWNERKLLNEKLRNS